MASTDNFVIVAHGAIQMALLTVAPNDIGANKIYGANGGCAILPVALSY